MKTHFGTGPYSACKRGTGRRITENVHQVTCLLCTQTDLFIRAKTTADIARKEAFDAQVPRECSAQFGGPVKCSECSGVLFRIGDRSCYGHYENYHCAGCGHVESRLTETGMSF
jgi:hypothetical protein